jgi:hypothetical protein
MVFGPELVKRWYLPFHRSLSIEMPFIEYQLHMLSHMYVVQSADDLSFLSSIEFVWCAGKKCKVVGTVHIIDP